jgi:hypothetical protein
VATVNDFQGWAKNTFGREANPNELQQIGQKVGAPAGAGGGYSPQQFSQGQAFATDMAKQQGWPGAQQQQPTPQQTPMPEVPVGNQWGTRSPLQQQLTDQVSKQMAQPLGNMQSDPIFQQQTQMFNAANQRSTDRQRAQLAEQAAQGGLLQSGGMNSKIRGLQEQQGLNEGGFAAELAGRRLQEQQDQINKAMALAMGIGDQDLQAKLYQQNKELALAQQDLQQQGLGLQKEGLNLQGELGRGDLDLRKYLGQGQLGLGLLNTNLSNQQANNALGYSYAQLQANMNRDAIMALLNGGPV